MTSSSHVEILKRENQTLKHLLDQSERENLKLKQSCFELSLKLDSWAHQCRLALEEIEDEVDIDLTRASVGSSSSQQKNNMNFMESILHQPFDLRQLLLIGQQKMGESSLGIKNLRPGLPKNRHQIPPAAAPVEAQLVRDDDKVMLASATTSNQKTLATPYVSNRSTPTTPSSTATASAMSGTSTTAETRGAAEKLTCETLVSSSSSSIASHPPGLKTTLTQQPTPGDHHVDDSSTSGGGGSSTTQKKNSTTTTTTNPETSAAAAAAVRGGRIFRKLGELRGHRGAVYCSKFSPCGRFLASGSFDKKALIWNVAKQQQIASLVQHQQLIMDCAWSGDSSQLLTGSYDHSCILWDVQQPQVVSCIKSNGDSFIQTLQFSIFHPYHAWLGTSQNQLELVDLRIKQQTSEIAQTTSTLIWQNDSIISAIHQSRSDSTSELGKKGDGKNIATGSSVGEHYILTGDARGALKTWDIRMPGCHSVLVNDEGHHPISGISAIKDIIAVNSYDNVLRVYQQQSNSGTRAPSWSLVDFLTGHKNRNWPISSSFYSGRGGPTYTLPSFSDSTSTTSSGRSRSRDDGEMMMDEDAHDHHGRRESTDDPPTDLIGSAVTPTLLATGSADSRVYVFDVTASTSRQQQRRGRSPPETQLIQKLSGHTDRVYRVDFHPVEPIIASASADSTIRLWAPLNTSSSSSAPSGNSSSIVSSTSSAAQASTSATSSVVSTTASTVTTTKSNIQ